MSENIRLKGVEVSDLFGIFNHSVQLRSAERVTILHGPNGVGKTVMLRLIQAFFGGRYDLLLGTNFTQLILELSDGRKVVVNRLENGDSSEGTKPSLTFTETQARTKNYVWTRNLAEYMRIASIIDNETPYISRVAEELWIDDRTGENFTVYDLVAKFGKIVPEKAKAALTQEPSWLQDFRHSIKVILVETQRLLNSTYAIEDYRYRPRGLSRKTFASTVKNYSADLQERIAAALASYAEHSQSLDRSFPQRMLGGPTPEALNTTDLKDRMNKLESRRAQLKKIGLIEDDTSYPFDIDTLDTASPTQNAVMTLYVKDTESKLSVFDELERKVDLLLGNINRKFRPNKHLRADRKSGLVVRDKKELRIDLDSLSSGEQHELVLVYDLLFRVHSHALVLIDEPELSLHVTWQKAFLKELFTIIEAGDFDVVLATHSPFIVGDRVDLMVPLALDVEISGTAEAIQATGEQ